MVDLFHEPPPAEEDTQPLSSQGVYEDLAGQSHVLFAFTNFGGPTTPEGISAANEALDTFFVPLPTVLSPLRPEGEGVGDEGLDDTQPLLIPPPPAWQRLSTRSLQDIAFQLNTLCDSCRCYVGDLFPWLPQAEADLAAIRFELVNRR